MEINKNNINRINNSPIPKTEKPKLSQQVETKDLSACPNPAEYLGRSQVVFKGKTNNIDSSEIKKEDLKPLELKPTKILPKEELIKVLKELAYTDEEIAQIDFNDEKITKGLSGVSAYFNLDAFKEQKEEIYNDFKSRSTEDKLNFINDEVKDMSEIIMYANQENIDKIKQHIDCEADDYIEIFNNIFNSDYPEKMLENIPLASCIKGKLSPRDVRDLRYCNVENPSPERINILKKINGFLPEYEKLSLAQCDNLGTDEELTPENIEQYLKLLEKYSQNSYFDVSSLKPSYRNETLNEITKSITQVDNVLEKYPINFETNDRKFKLSISNLEKLTQRADIENLSKFINSLTPNAKVVGLNNLPEENSKIDKTKLAQLLNIVSADDYGDVNKSGLIEFIKQQEDNNYENLDGIIKLIQRYKGTNSLNTSDLDRPLTVGKNDYESALSALDLKDEIDKKDLDLNDYYFYQTLHDPDCDLKNFKKMLQYINDNNIKSGEFEYGNYRPNYSPYFFTEPKGLNKLMMNYKVGKYMNSDQKAQLLELAEMLNNEEEVNYALDLMEQKRFPKGEDYSSRFGWNIDFIKELMQSYQNDKESTTAILDMKTKDGNWRISSKDSVIDTIKAYQLDKNATLDILDMKTPKGYPRFYDGKDIKSLVESLQIDKEYTEELLELKDETCDRKEYRFEPQAVCDIVKSAQIDKEFTNYLLKQKYVDEYGIERYRIHRSEDYIYFVQKAQEDKEYVTSLFDMKDKKYDGTEIPRLSSQTIEYILDNPLENKEFLLNIINAKEERWGEEHNVYSDYQISDLARIVKTNRNLTERLLNEKIYTTNYKKEIEEHTRFRSISDIASIVNDSVIDPEFTEELLDYTEKQWNGDIYPRFDSSDIGYLLRLRKEGIPKDEITKFINETTATYDDRAVPRFRAGDIYQIFNLYKRDKELTDTLLAETVVSKNGKPYYLYSVSGINDILNSMDIDKEYTSELLERNRKSDLKRGSYDIYTLVSASKVNKELTKELADYKIERKGELRYRFSAEEISEIVHNPELDLAKVRRFAKIKDAEGKLLETNIICTLAKSDNAVINNIMERETDDGNLALTQNEIKKLLTGMHYSYNITDDMINSKDYINTIFNMCKDENFSNYDISLYTNFNKFLDKNHTYELTKLEKKDLLMTLLFNKSALNGENHLNNGLVPSGSKEYAQLIKKITDSLSIDLPPLSEEALEKFDTKLNALANELKTADLSDLNEIKLTISQEKFKSDVLNIFKDLDRDEQSKIQDYFGFRIEGDALSGYPTIQNKDLSNSEITDENSIKALNKVKTFVEEYTNNNFVTIKDKPSLNNLLNDIAKDMPELYNQVDDTNSFVNTIKSLQKIVQKPNYEKLSETDKRVLILATLLHNTDKVSNSTSESAFDAYFISKKFGITDEEAQKIYKIVESSDLINKFMSATRKETVVNTRNSQIKGKDIENVFDLLAFNLKEGNLFELAQMLYTTKEKDGLTRHLDKLLQTRIKEIKSNDFMLPQTSQQTYFDYSSEQEIAGHKVKVVQADSIPNMHAYIHTPEAGYATGGSRDANLANFEIFKDFSDDKVICTSYVTPDKAALVREFRHGFIFDVKNERQYVAYNRDIFSLAKNIPNMLIEYYRDRGFKANRNKGEKFTHRSNVSDKLKEYMGITDEEYIKKLDTIKSKLGKETLTMEKLKSIDSDLYNAYEKLFESDDLLNRQNHNEALVSSPQISAIFTNNIDNLPEEYLIMAEEQNLPIVVFDTNEKKENDS